MLQRFIEIISDLELSFKPIAVIIALISGDRSGDVQNDALDDDILLLLSLSSWLFMTVGLLLLGLKRISNSGFSVEDIDLMISGILESVKEIIILELSP
jgi:hypothetical protein